MVCHSVWAIIVFQSSNVLMWFSHTDLTISYASLPTISLPGRFFPSATPVPMTISTIGHSLYPLVHISRLSLTKLTNLSLCSTNFGSFIILDMMRRRFHILGAKETRSEAPRFKSANLDSKFCNFITKCLSLN